MKLMGVKSLLINDKSIEGELFNLGLNWEEKSTPQTVLVQIPHSQNAAGLISFGLMCRDLCNPEKNNKVEHFNELIVNATAYLNQCKSCKFSCKPDVAECGRTCKATNELKNIKESRIYRIESITSNDSNQSIYVSYSNKPTKKTPFPNKVFRYIQKNYSEDWHCKGRAQLFCHHKNSLSLDIYRKLNNGKICTDNLAFSYSGLVYVGSNKKNSERDANAIIVKVNDKTPTFRLINFKKFSYH